MIRILLVDDHPVVRMGLRGMLDAEPDLTVIGEASSGVEGAELALRERPDIVLMDLRMPGGDGVSAIRELRDRLPEIRVLVLTTYGDDADVLAAIDAGATGYLLKDAPREELLRGVRAAADGQSVLSPAVAATLLGRVRAPEPETPLSPRELEVLRLVAAGRGNREAAAELFISEATVKTHLLHVYAKLGVNDRAAAVAAGYERGLLGGA